MSSTFFRVSVRHIMLSLQFPLIFLSIYILLSIEHSIILSLMFSPLHSLFSFPSSFILLSSLSLPHPIYTLPPLPPSVSSSIYTSSSCFTLFYYFQFLYCVPFSFCFSKLFLSSSLRFFSFSLSSSLWSFVINTLEYSSEFLSLFAFIRISLVVSSFPSLTSTGTGLVSFSSLFPSQINCFCSTCCTPISSSNIILRASSSSLNLSLASSLFDSGRL